MRTISQREQALANRETWVGARERASSEHDMEVTEREEIVRLREETLRARSEAEEARLEREHLIDQMREANEALLLAALRTEELMEALHTSNRAKDEFLAMLGHELRNPLAPIVTALDLLSMQEDSHQREHAVIRRQVMHLAHLVDDLLDVSRITTGKIELRLERIELAHAVSQALEIASPLLERKAHVLKIDVPRGLVINADAMRLAQAIGNLVTNAAKFTPPHGSIVLTGEHRGATIALRVRDTGIGMSKQMLPRIFDLFTQERQSLDRSAGGLGLGLAIVRSLVTMHGGTVTAHSEGLGRGSELVIELPATSKPIGDKPASDAWRAETIDKRRILVVDDNRDAAELIAESLSSVGHDVHVAFDGPQALAIVRTFIPEVVLLDIGLPVMDGYEVLGRMRPLLPAGTRFIALTGYGRSPDHKHSEEAGFDLHLVKPVTIANLQRAIQRTMQGR